MDDGADVFILGRNSAKLKEAGSVLLQNSFSDMPPFTVRADVSKPEDCERSIAEVLERTEGWMF